MAERTRRLVNKYISRPDVLCLVVVEATASSVRNSLAFSLVAEAGKTDRAIGVLTKADACAGPTLKRLIERLKGRAKDLPELAHGYLCVVNRDSSDESGALSIDAAAGLEAKWLGDYLPADLAKANGGGVLVGRLSGMLDD